MYIFEFWFEHGGGSIWAKNSKASNTYAGGVGYTDYDNLPISKELINKLRSLDEEYSTILDWNEPINPYLWSTAQKLDFYYRANLVRLELEEELGYRYKFIDGICSSLALNPKLTKLIYHNDVSKK